MTEQCKHEWNITGTPAMFEIVCSSPNCAREMSFDEAEARLNATERLSAAEARAISDGIFGEWGVPEETLMAYANILEGKDE